MIEWDAGLRVAGTGLYLDARTPRARCVVTHAHSDHVAAHQHAYCTAATRDLAERRISVTQTTTLDYDVETRLQANPLSQPSAPSSSIVHPGSTVGVTLFPAGHVLGSAMVRVTSDQGSLLYTGDFKLRHALTVPPARPVQADVLVMETTYGKPFFRFPPRQQVIDELVDRVSTALRDGKQPIVMGYSLGKAQEIVRVLTDAGLPVTEHGAVANLSDVYEHHGVRLGPRRRYAAADFKGKSQLPLEERGVIVAPPQVARSGFVQGFDDPANHARGCCTIMCSGWALLKGAQYRYGVDRVVPLSDHADFDELLELVDIVQPKRIYTLHGYPDFADHLRSRGLDARLAKPDPQLGLFD
jgi:Cft2 family RNA processing exonuclease